MELQTLQQKQAEYDAKYWEVNDSDFEKIRHISHHMGKLLGKMATYCEAKEHNLHASEKISTDKIRKEVVPDLMVYALQLSNLLQVKLDEAYLERLDQNIQRLFPENR